MITGPPPKFHGTRDILRHRGRRSMTGMGGEEAAELEFDQAEGGVGASREVDSSSACSLVAVLQITEPLVEGRHGRIVGGAVALGGGDVAGAPGGRPSSHHITEWP